MVFCPASRAAWITASIRAVPVPGGLDHRLHQGGANAPLPVLLFDAELQCLAHTVALKLQHDHAHNLPAAAGQQHTAAPGDKAVGIGQHLQVYRLQQVILQQPGQRDVLQILFVALLERSS